MAAGARARRDRALAARRRSTLSAARRAPAPGRSSRSSSSSRSPRPWPTTSPTCGSTARASGSRTRCASRSTSTCTASRSAITSDAQKGDLVARVTEDVTSVGRPVRRVARDDRPGRAAAGRDGGRDASRSTPLLALVSFLAMPALALLSYHYRVRVRQGARAQRAHEGEIASLAGEALSAMAVVKASGLRALRGRARARAQRRAHARRDPGLAAAGALRRADRRGQRGRHRAGHRARRPPDRRRLAVARRPGRLRHLRAPPEQPAARHRARGDEGLAHDGARRPDRRGARRRRAARGPPGRLRGSAGGGRGRARATSRSATPTTGPCVEAVALHIPAGAWWRWSGTPAPASRRSAR